MTAWASEIFGSSCRNKCWRTTHASRCIKAMRISELSHNLGGSKRWVGGHSIGRGRRVGWVSKTSKLPSPQPAICLHVYVAHWMTWRSILQSNVWRHHAGKCAVCGRSTYSKCGLCNKRICLGAGGKGCALDVALCPLLPWYCVKSSWNIWFRDYQHVFLSWEGKFSFGKRLLQLNITLYLIHCPTYHIFGWLLMSH